MLIVGGMERYVKFSNFALCIPTLKVELRSDTHEKVHVVFIVMGYKGLSSSTTGNSVHHGSFNLGEVTAIDCLHAIPSEHYGFQDKELRFRQRYLDLIMNDRSREIFRTRAKIK
jgi:lysyl-tRNA synthetase class II